MTRARRYGFRLLALFLPLAVLACLWALVAAPLIGSADRYQDQRDSLVALIAAQRRAIAAGPAWQAAFSSLQQAAAQNPGTRPEPSEALAEAGLQNDMQQIIATAGGQIVSVEPQPATSRNGFQAISLKISLTLPAAAIADFLRAVETHQPDMFITAASLQNPNPGIATDADMSNPPMTILCTITAYRRP